jgi:rhodanese-related sulfurtransferase
MPATIRRDELLRKIQNQEPFILVETLSPEQYQRAHLPGAIDIPPDQIRQLAPQLLPDKNAEIVVYCASPT